MSVGAIKRLCGILVALLVPLPAVLLFFHGNWYSFFHSYSLAMFFGIFGYGYFCVALMLSARLRLLDRLYGHDRVLVFHGIMAGLALLAAFLHAVFKRMFMPGYTLQIVLGIAGFTLFVGVILLTVVFMIQTPLNRFFLTAGIFDKINKCLPIDYSLLKLLHNLTSLALLLIVVHVLLAWPVQENMARTFLMGSMGFLALVIFIHHKFIRPAVCFLRAGQVTAVRRLCPSITEIELEPPASRRFAQRPGQFCYFRFLSPVCGRAEHPFTISSAPGDSKLSIIVKDLGDYTAKLTHLQIGAKALVDGPYGVFSPRPAKQPLLFLAGGIGITPLLAILRDYRENPPDRNVRLIWSVHDPEELVVLEELQQMQAQCAFFQLDVRVTGGINPVSGKQDSRLDKPTLEQCLSSLGKEEVAVYLCGPESFRRGTITRLRSLGVPASRIHFEKFSF